LGGGGFRGRLGPPPDLAALFSEGGGVAVFHIARAAVTAAASAAVALGANPQAVRPSSSFTQMAACPALVSVLVIVLRRIIEVKVSVIGTMRLAVTVYFMLKTKTQAAFGFKINLRKSKESFNDLTARILHFDLSRL
jgi:hypothetical protein